MNEKLNKLLKEIDPSLSSVVWTEGRYIRFEIYEERKHEDQFICSGWYEGEKVYFDRWSASIPLGELTFLTPYQVRKVRKVTKDFFETT